MAAASHDVPPHRAFLSMFVCGDIATKRQSVISVAAEQSTESVLELLKLHNILSVPVRHPKDSEEAKRGLFPFMGIANIWDIVTVVAFDNLFDKYDDTKLDEGLLKDADIAQVFKLDIFKAPISTILGVSKESARLWCFRWNDPLDKLLDAFSLGVHRVLIVGEPIKGDESMQPSYRLVSQSDVVRFLWDAHGYQLTHGVVRHHDLAKLFLAKIKDLNLVTDNATHKGEIVSMSTKNSAVTGFRKMSIHDLSGLPVLGDNGVLAGTLSESDLRGITQETFKHALLPVMDFLARVQRKPGEPFPKNIAVEGDATLHHVIELIVKNHVHRVWVVDAHKHVKGVITLSDIISKFAPYDYTVAGR